MSASSDGDLRIVEDDLSHPAVVALLKFHLAEAFRNSPADSVFALDLERVRQSITLWTMWRGETLTAMGGLGEIAPGHGEIKSMRTADAAQRQGLGARMLTHLIAAARQRGYTLVSLETGNNHAFASARRLYERAGFEPCEAFGDYRAGGFNTFYARAV